MVIPGVSAGHPTKLTVQGPVATVAPNVKGVVRPLTIEVGKLESVMPASPSPTDPLMKAALTVPQKAITQICCCNLKHLDPLF